MTAIPTEMLFVRCDGFGPPEVLKPARRPVPQPGVGEVLIRVAAAGVNRPDVLQRQGGYPPPAGAPDWPGLEVAGEVVATGPGTARYRPGARVCALVSGGGYAEYCAAPEAQVLPVPAGMDYIAAAAVPETFFTVWTNVFERGHLQKGQTFLVHGGSSGIGTTAIQLAKAFGARVFATAGSAEKCAACERLGAEAALNYRDRDWVTDLRAATGGAGIDLILDMVGGDYTARNLDLLADDGRLVQIAFLKSPRVELDLMQVMRRRLTITGSTLRPRTVAEKGAIAAALEQHVWPLLTSGTVAPVVAATFPLAAAAEAHRLMESSRHIGKIVLTTGQAS